MLKHEMINEVLNGLVNNIFQQLQSRPNLQVHKTAFSFKQVDGFEENYSLVNKENLSLFLKKSSVNYLNAENYIESLVSNINLLKLDRDVTSDLFLNFIKEEYMTKPENFKVFKNLFLKKEKTHNVRFWLKHIDAFEDLKNYLFEEQKFGSLYKRDRNTKSFQDGCIDSIGYFADKKDKIRFLDQILNQNIDNFNFVIDLKNRIEQDSVLYECYEQTKVKKKIDNLINTSLNNNIFLDKDNLKNANAFFQTTSCIIERKMQLEVKTEKIAKGIASKEIWASIGSIGSKQTNNIKMNDQEGTVTVEIMPRNGILTITLTISGNIFFEENRFEKAYHEIVEKMYIDFVNETNMKKAKIVSGNDISLISELEPMTLISLFMGKFRPLLEEQILQDREDKLINNMKDVSPIEKKPVKSRKI